MAEIKLLPVAGKNEMERHLRLLARLQEDGQDLGSRAAHIRALGGSLTRLSSELQKIAGDLVAIRRSQLGHQSVASALILLAQKVENMAAHTSAFPD